LSVERSELNVERSVPKGAIFLSYASQDAEAAKRIADALRAAGVEVWFDQNELVGGDAWDAKIRGQIASCALFLPIISANTQARLEGYFRREWKQAAARTQDMADEKTFLLPVVIDDTRDAHAKVPPEFKAVQWTRLTAGETPPAFVSRVKKLLGDEPGAAKAAPVIPHSKPATSNRRLGRLWWLAPIVGVTIALVLLLRDKAQGPAPVSAPAASSVDALVAKGRALLDDDPLMTRANVELAEQIGLEAVAKDPMNAEANALVAWTNFLFLQENYDKSPQRLSDLKKYADKALLLAPDSVHAELAACGVLVITREHDEAFRRLQVLADRKPGDLLVLRTWAWISLWGRGGSWGVGRDEEPPAMARLRAHSPLGRAYADSFAAGRAWVRGNYVEADRLIDGVFASGHPVKQTYLVRLLVLTFGWGDLPAAREFAKTIPAKLLLEDVFINHVSTLWLHSGEYEQALEILSRASRPLLHEARVVTPTAELRGRALAAAGRGASAALQWNEVLKVVGQQLEREQDNDNLRASRVVALARLGDLTAARKEFALVQELRKAAPGNRTWAIDFDLAMELGDLDETVARFDRAIAEDNPRWANSYNHARYDPMFAALRADPRVKPIMARAEKWLAALRAKAAGGDERPDAAPAAADDKSVAVLAFANLSDDKNNEYFSDGISEELLNVLAKVPGLKVSARTSAFYFKGKEVPVPEIAKQLGVAYVVEGSVRKAGDKVRITAQLIKAADGFHVWSDTFTRDLKDIFAVQDEIAGLIAKSLELKIGVTAAVRTVDPEAYQLYLQALPEIATRTMAGFDRAEQLINRTIARDPGFVPAQAALAVVWCLRAVQRRELNSRDTPLRQQIIQQAERALKMGPDSAEAQAACGFVYTVALRFTEGEAMLRRAIQLNPSYAPAYLWLGRSLLGRGYIEDAIATLKQSVTLDPLSHRALDNLAFTLVDAGRLREALGYVDQALRVRPESSQALAVKAQALARMGRVPEALALIDQVAPVVNNVDEYIIEVNALAGRRAQLDALLAPRAGDNPNPCNRFYVLAALGRDAEAFEALDQAIIDWGFMDTFLFSPLLDRLRTHPRFIAKLQAADLTEIHARAQAWRAAHPPEQPEAFK
jgi:TolB-like protein/Flp pilus assembly protein TadD